MTRISVRRLRPDDWELYRDVRLTALAESPSAFMSTLAREEQFAEADWRDRLAVNCCAVAFRDADGTGMDPVGLAAGYVDEEQAAQLVSMWVSPDARGSSAADALIDAVSSWAAQEGHLTLALWVVDGNDRAERVYARNGFVRTGRTQPVRAGGPTTEFEMIRLLPRDDVPPAPEPG